MKIIIILFPLLLLYCGCRVDRQASVDQEAERMKLLATEIEFSKKSLEVGAAEAFRMFAEEQATELPAQALPIIGRDSIYLHMKRDDTTYQLQWQPQRAEVSSGGDLGYTWGTYELKFRAAKDSSSKVHGKYVTVWRKQPNGLWRWIVDIGNQSSSQ